MNGDPTAVEDRPVKVQLIEKKKIRTSELFRQ